MLHRLCGPRQFILSFNLAAVLPGGLLNALAPEATPPRAQPQVDIVWRGLPGYLILFAPHAFRT